MTDAPCKVCIDNSCHGCQISMRQAAMLCFTGSVHESVEYTQANIRALHDAGIITQSEACELLEALWHVVHHANKVLRLCEAAFVPHTFLTTSTTNDD